MWLGLSYLAPKQSILLKKAWDILFLKILDYSTYFFLSALVGVENVFNFSRETGVTKKIKQMAADLYNTKTDAKIGSNFI